jgi:hypothetical protein
MIKTVQLFQTKNYKMLLKNMLLNHSDHMCIILVLKTTAIQIYNNNCSEVTRNRKYKAKLNFFRAAKKKFIKSKNIK